MSSGHFDLAPYRREGDPYNFDQLSCKRDGDLRNYDLHLFVPLPGRRAPTKNYLKMLKEIKGVY